ncbi:MAG: GHKL domain-containing protein [Deltaproteobacteria bacterium]|nr:GHKL domain-containing protein [Deltaproteobacteria bacterium]
MAAADVPVAVAVAAEKVAIVDTKQNHELQFSSSISKTEKREKNPLAASTAEKRKLPLWLANLLLFGALILAVLLYFFWQADREQRSFYRHTREHTQLLAQVIQLNADNAIAAAAVIKTVARTFMLNSARFIDYLAAIEPFTEAELTALALESGLNGITIDDGQTRVSGPPQWQNDYSTISLQKNDNQIRFTHNIEGHIFTLNYPRQEGEGNMWLAFGAQRLESLQKQVGIEQLLATLSRVPGINYVRLEPAKLPPTSPPQLLKEIITDRGMIVEARLPMNGQTLTAGFKSNFLVARKQGLWRDFFLFALLLGGLGCFCSWLLYRYQLASLLNVRRYEQRLAHEREDAALGRAAAALAHEIRNPLNAISLGLQRLEIEESGLKSEYDPLVSAMRNAVGRADSIVGDLRRFAQPLNPERNALDICNLITDIIALYQTKADTLAIEISMENKLSTLDRFIPADADLLGQALENLSKNALEAQPEGGFLKITLQKNNQELELIFENGGLEIPKIEIKKIIEPWFTTKTHGTGLGLAMVERIIRAHNGRFEVESTEPGILRQYIFLPYK